MRPEQTAPAMAYVDALVRAAFQLEAGALRCPDRGNPRTAFARQVAVYLMHTRLGLTLTEAAAFYGRDRTTAAHACRAVEARRENVATDSIVDCLDHALEVWMACGQGGTL